MKQYDNKKLSEQQQRNMQFVDDRFEFLDTIRDMIDIELDRRGVSADGNYHNHTENPPPDKIGKER